MSKYEIEIPDDTPWLKTHRPVALRRPVPGDLILDSLLGAIQVTTQVTQPRLIVEPLPAAPPYPKEWAGKYVFKHLDMQYVSTHRPYYAQPGWVDAAGDVVSLRGELLEVFRYPFPEHLPDEKCVVQITEDMCR